MGSYFGSSLCAVDLNADGLSDLLVGAPMFSEIRDEGQVTVYINRGNVSTVLGSLWTGCGRGSCLASSNRAPSGPRTAPCDELPTFRKLSVPLMESYNCQHTGVQKILMAVF